jgi:acetyl-CoA synthetase
MGWIMGPWTVVGGGAMGVTIVFAEGAPDWPADRLWRLVEEERVTILGCSPTLIRALIPHGAPQADLSSLRVIVTTGEPWNPGPYRWLFDEVGRRARSSLLGRYRDRRLLSSTNAGHADQDMLRRRTGTGYGHGRRR